MTSTLNQINFDPNRLSIALPKFDSGRDLPELN